VVCGMDRSRGLLTVDDFKRARTAVEAEPRVESIRGKAHPLRSGDWYSKAACFDWVV
jgi:hypothetical protein